MTTFNLKEFLTGNKLLISKKTKEIYRFKSFKDKMITLENKKTKYFTKYNLDNPIQIDILNQSFCMIDDPIKLLKDFKSDNIEVVDFDESLFFSGRTFIDLISFSVVSFVIMDLKSDKHLWVVDNNEDLVKAIKISKASISKKKKKNVLSLIKTKNIFNEAIEAKSEIEYLLNKVF